MQWLTGAEGKWDKRVCDGRQSGKAVRVFTSGVKSIPYVVGRDVIGGGVVEQKSVMVCLGQSKLGMTANRQPTAACRTPRSCAKSALPSPNPDTIPIP